MSRSETAGEVVVITVAETAGVMPREGGPKQGLDPCVATSVGEPEGRLVPRVARGRRNLEALKSDKQANVLGAGLLGRMSGDVGTHGVIPCAAEGGPALVRGVTITVLGHGEDWPLCAGSRKGGPGGQEE